MNNLENLRIFENWLKCAIQAKKNMQGVILNQDGEKISENDLTHDVYHRIKRDYYSLVRSVFNGFFPEPQKGSSPCDMNSYKKSSFYAYSREMQIMAVSNNFQSEGLCICPFENMDSQIIQKRISNVFQYALDKLHNNFDELRVVKDTRLWFE